MRVCVCIGVIIFLARCCFSDSMLRYVGIRDIHTFSWYVGVIWIVFFLSFSTLNYIVILRKIAFFNHEYDAEHNFFLYTTFLILDEERDYFHPRPDQIAEKQLFSDRFSIVILNFQSIR